MVSRQTVSQLDALRERGRRRLRVWGIPIVLIAAAGCGASTETSTGPSPTKCLASVALSAPVVAAAGGTGALTVTTERECTWTIASAVAWISGLTPASGQGSAQVTFSVATNAEATQRQGDLVVNEQRIAVRQEAAACRYDIAPRSWSLAAGGGEWEVKVTAVNGCTWRATSNTSWIRVKSGESGTRDGTVVAEADVNAEQDGRTGSLTIAGEGFAVAQSGTSPSAPPVPPPPTSAPPAPLPPPPPSFTCSYTLSPSSHAATAAGGASMTSVQTNHPGCVWNVSSDAAWLTFTTAAGVGNQSVGFAVAANPGGSRTGHLTIGVDRS